MVARQREVDLEGVRKTVGTAEHRALAQDIAQRALTLVRDSGNAVPLAQNAKIAIVNYMPETELKASRAFVKEMTRLRPTTKVAGKILPNAAATQLDSLARSLADADAIVIAAYVRRVEGEGRTTVPVRVAAWIDSVSSARRAVVVAFGNPYILRQFPRARAYMNTYGIGDALEIAAARALAGAARVTGKSPVSLPGYFKAGDGINR
jgi:beta-N-acetylhexosaminidase